MSIKIDNILKRFEVKGKVIVKMDLACGYNQITLTRGVNGNIIVGTIPGGKLVSAAMADVRAVLEANALYINSWS